MRNTIKTIVGGLGASLILAACAGPEAWSENGKAGVAQAFDSRPVYLRAMKTQLATPRAAIGPLLTGTACTPKGEVLWDDTLFRQVSHQLPKIFRRDLQRAHFQVPPDSGQPMAVSHAAHPEYIEVDMRVQDLNARLCMQEEGSSGSAYMEIFWQVYDAGASTPLYETVTQGRYEAPIMEKHTQADFFAKAFSAALGELLADRSFQEAVKQSAVR